MKQLQIKNLIIGDGVPKICAPIIGSNEPSIIQQAESILHTSADLIEWRIDFFEHYSDWKKIEITGKKLRQLTQNIPLLFTFRTKQEGGQSDISKQEYQTLLTQAINSHLFDLIDIELLLDLNIVKSLIALGKEQNTTIILSSHNFFSTPTKDEIISRLKQMEILGADIAKIAVMPKTKDDVITLLSATIEQTKESSIPVVTMSMGQLGIISRICGTLTGSAITFGCINHSSAPGQLNINDLSQILHTLTNKSNT